MFMKDGTKNETHTTENPSDAFKAQLKSDSCRVFAAAVSQHIYFTSGDASVFKKGSPVQRSKSTWEQDETCVDGARRPHAVLFLPQTEATWTSVVHMSHRFHLLCPGHTS